METDDTPQAVGDACARRLFEEAWRAGQPAPIEQFLPNAKTASYMPTLEALVFLELQFFWERYADGGAAPPSARDYLERFPCLNRVEYAERLDKHEEWLRSRHGEPATVAAFSAPSLSSSAPAAAEAVPIPPLPSVPGYQIEGVLSRGGMGVVYRARQVGLDRPVALKMILAGSHAGPALIERFRREALAVARLQHPHVVQIFEIGEHEGRPFFTMELVEGGPLSRRIAATPQPVRPAAQLVQTLAHAVHAAHGRGVIHRDLKPANVLLAEDGTPKVADFGLAKPLEDDASQTRTGEVVGTPSYMAPEQAAGRSKEVGPATDVYALGAILYELLTGRPPFRGESSWDTMQQVLTSEPVPPARLRPGLSRDLETICLKCLAKEPARRYASAEALADDLRRFLAGEPIAARRIGPVGRLARWCRRQPALTATIALAALTVAMVTAVGFISVIRERDRYRSERDRAEENYYRVLVGEAEAQLRGRDTGWRWKAMDNLATAARLDVSTRDPIRLRELAIQCIGAEYPCLRPLGRWTGHVGPVHAVALSPDGTLAASGGEDRTVRLWSVPGGATIAALTEQTGRVTVVEFRPDGRQLASAAEDGTVCFRDIGAGGRPGPARVLRPPGAGPIHAGAYSPDGEWFAAACNDGTIRLLPTSAPNGAPPAARTLQGHSRRATCLAFLPGGKMLASGSADLTIRFWSIPAGTEVARWDGIGDNPPNSLAIQAGGGLLAYALPASQGIVLKTIDGETVTVLNHLHARSVTRVFFGRGMAVFTASLDGTVKAWERRGHEFREVAVARREGDAFRAAALAADGRWVLTGGEDGCVCLWQLADSPQRVFLPVKNQSAVFAGPGRLLVNAPLAYDLSVDLGASPRRLGPAAIGALEEFPDGRLALGDDDGVLRLWDRARGVELKRQRAHEGPVRALALRPGGTTLASAGADGTVKLWDGATGRLERTHRPGIGLLHALAWSRDGTHLAVSGEAGVVLCDAGGAKPPRPLHREPLRAGGVAFGTGMLALCLPGGAVELRVVPSGKLLRRVRGHNGGTTAVAFSPDGALLATGGRDLRIRLWDATTGAERAALRITRVAPTWLAFGPEGSRLLAAGGPLTPSRVYDLDGPRILTDLTGVGTLDSAGRFSADGAALLLGTILGSVRSFARADIEQVRQAADKSGLGWGQIGGARFVVPGGHNDTIWGVAADRDGRRIATASHDGTVKLWDAQSLQLERTLTGSPSPLWCAAFSGDGRWVAAGSYKGEVLVWETQTGALWHRFSANEQFVGSVVFHPTRPWLASTGSDRTIRLWDVAARAPLGELHRVEAPHFFHQLAFSPDGRWLAGAGEDHRVALWDMRGTQFVSAPPTHRLAGHTAPVLSVGFSADGRRLAAGATHGVILLWETVNLNAPLLKLQGGPYQIRSVSFSRDGGLLAGAAYVGSTTVWDLEHLRRTLAAMDLDW